MQCNTVPSVPSADQSRTIDRVYCPKLASCWRGVSEKQLERRGTVHQIAGSSLPRGSGRKHQLMSATEVNQFFDCTIQIDLWRSAYPEGQCMHPGKHYRLQNVRMKEGKDKCLEANIRVNRLKSGDNMNVLDLEDVNLKLTEYMCPQTLVILDLKLLHKDIFLRAIYVSDYSLHPRVTSARGLAGYTLRIKLRGKQVGKISKSANITTSRVAFAAKDTQEIGSTLSGSNTLISPLGLKIKLTRGVEIIESYLGVVLFGDVSTSASPLIVASPAHPGTRTGFPILIFTTKTKQ
ncbi:hypothetical protein C8F04DRAFT_1174445 [Mycena alexandri]|uniref:Uncharacterized protein n=1 Tax=Mycena alexandri TaxID=1745969 RepID=A0AAD6TI45_9AGAR|nr:hypothetical protein C8F04DRAFT_1174445 [Mycena alexandri]